MSQILSLNKFEEIASLIAGESEMIDATLVDKEIADDPNNYFLQVKPYISFYVVDVPSAKLKLVQYRKQPTPEEIAAADEATAKQNEASATETTDSTNSDSPAKEPIVPSAATSIGFGDYIQDNTITKHYPASLSKDGSGNYEAYSEEVKVIKAGTTVKAEDGSTNFVMNKDELAETMLNATKYIITQLLGYDPISKYNITLDVNNCAYFMGDPRVKANMVHVGFCVPIKLTEDQFNDLIESTTFAKDQIDLISSMTVNIDKLVEEMDITSTTMKISAQLMEKHNMEDWSCRVFEFIVRKELFHILSKVNYKEMYDKGMLVE